MKRITDDVKLIFELNDSDVRQALVSFVLSRVPHDFDFCGIKLAVNIVIGESGSSTTSGSLTAILEVIEPEQPA